MKAVSTVSLFSLAMLAASVASARSLEQAYLDSCRKGPAIPVPISVVSPTVSSEYSGSKVELEFVVDPSGKPTDLTVKSAKDEDVGEAVMEAVKQWKFKPAERNGAPVATKVILPVKIVDVDSDSIFAAN